MPSYYTNARGQWFVDPVVENYTGLIKRTVKEFETFIEEQNTPTTDQLLQQLTQARKEKERQGVVINGIRYAGDPGNRQALREAIAYIEDAGLTEFPAWKDSDDVFHADHPLADVKDAVRAIGARRSQLIAAEGEYAAQIAAGTLTDLSEVVWP
jgi:hypothetical protein